MSESMEREVMVVEKGDTAVLELGEHNWNRLLKYCEIAVKGGFAGRHKSVESAFCAAIYGLEVGLSVNQALQNVNVINGRAGMEAKAKLALVMSSGLCAKLPEEWIENVQWIDDPSKYAQVIAHCKVERNGRVVERTFSMADAKRAGLLGKDNWRFYARDMLKYRARDRTLDDAFADVTKGLVTLEAIDHEFRREGTNRRRGSIETLKVSGTTEETKDPAPKEEEEERVIDAEVVEGDDPTRLTPEERAELDDMGDLPDAKDPASKPLLPGETAKDYRDRVRQSEFPRAEKPKKKGGRKKK